MSRVGSQRGVQVHPEPCNSNSNSNSMCTCFHASCLNCCPHTLFVQTCNFAAQGTYCIYQYCILPVLHPTSTANPTIIMTDKTLVHG
jgi:hypothetical protein